MSLKDTFVKNIHKWRLFVSVAIAKQTLPNGDDIILTMLDIRLWMKKNCIETSHVLFIYIVLPESYPP